MESLSHYTDSLTQLYSQAKRSALSNVEKQDTTFAPSARDRKFRIQKDRLITWGLQWSDEETGPNGSIDESVARAGFTETVDSVLRNIKDVLDQADKLHPSASLAEKASSPANHDSKYQDLLQDLTVSIDILYDLSRSRRAIASGTHPTFSGHLESEEADDQVPEMPTSFSKSVFQTPSFASSEVTLVNQPSFSRPNLSPYAGLPPIIGPDALILPAEGPPPYDSVGTPAATRMIARLLRSKLSESLRAMLNSDYEEVVVLVEYANFDPLYRETGVPPPLQKLESLSGFLQNPNYRHQQDITLLGYFEDQTQPRIGLVYDFLGQSHDRAMASAIDIGDFYPVTLLNMLQASAKVARPTDGPSEPPALEDRFRLALRITERMRDLHCQGLSHGDISSGNTLFFAKGRNQKMRKEELRSPVLSSFDIFSRCSVGRTASEPGLNIYKHPSATGDMDEHMSMKYDLYSLGLLLLEVGLWAPLGSIWKSKYSLTDFKRRLEKIWIPRLGWKCGSVYMRAVESCFRLSDHAASDLPLQRAYDSILGRIQRCCLLDEDEPLEQSNIGAAPTSAYSDPWSQFTGTTKKQRSATPQGEDTNKFWPSEKKALSNILSYTPSPSPASHFISPSAPPMHRETSSHSLPMVASPTQRSSNEARNDSLSSEVSANPQEIGRRSTLDRAVPRAGEAVPMPAASRRKAETRSAGDLRQTDTVARTETFFPMDLPQDILDDWRSRIAPRLVRICERALKGSTESSSVGLHGLGYDASSVRPTILITCASTEKVKAAVKRNLRKLGVDRSIFDIKVRKGRINLCRGQSRRKADSDEAKRCSRRGSDVSESDSVFAVNPYYHQRPLCGASIGAYLPDYGHLMPVSFGGVILVDGKPFGLSVHHMLEPPSDDEHDGDSDAIGGADDEYELEREQPATRSSANNAYQRQWSIPTASSNLSLNSRPEYSSDVSEVDDEEGGYASSDFESDISDTESLADDRIEPGDTAGVDVEDDQDIVITQPALDDALAENLHVDDIETEELDEDHLLSYRLGDVYASSGLRRLQHNGTRHEVDWALIKLESPRLQPYNLVQGGRRYCKSPSSFRPSLENPVCRLSEQYTAEEDLYPTHVASSTTLANLNVHCFGRTSGLKTGRIGAVMSFVRIRGRATYSSSWAVEGDFGVGGDSGAWVIDNSTGSVCGHVLAERQGVTYICPMEVMLEDIKSTLGAERIALPGGAGEDDGKTVAAVAVAGEGVAAMVGTLSLGSELPDRSRVRDMQIKRKPCVYTRAVDRIVA